MTTQSNRPGYGVYHVEEGKGDRKGFWTKVGAAWKHEKGDGFSIQLTVLPIDGRLVVRKLEAKELAERDHADRGE